MSVVPVVSFIGNSCRSHLVALSLAGVAASGTPSLSRLTAAFHDALVVKVASAPPMWLDNQAGGGAGGGGGRVLGEGGNGGVSNSVTMRAHDPFCLTSLILLSGLVPVPGAHGLF